MRWDVTAMPGESRSRNKKTSRQWDGKMSGEYELWLGDHFSSWLPDRDLLEIRTPEGFELVHPGDIVRKLEGGDCIVSRAK